MKKIISILLTTCMLVITMTACGTVSQQDIRPTVEHSTEENVGDADDEPNQPIDNGYWHDEDPTEEPSSTEEPTTTEPTTTTVNYALPAGASSPYELYTIVYAFYINGSGYERFQQIAVPEIRLVYYLYDDFEEDVDLLNLSIEDLIEIIPKFNDFWTELVESEIVYQDINDEDREWEISDETGALSLYQSFFSGYDFVTDENCVELVFEASREVYEFYMFFSVDQEYTDFAGCVEGEDLFSNDLTDIDYEEDTHEYTGDMRVYVSDDMWETIDTQAHYFYIGFTEINGSYYLLYVGQSVSALGG